MGYFHVLYRITADIDWLWLEFYLYVIREHPKLQECGTQDQTDYCRRLWQYHPCLHQHKIICPGKDWEDTWETISWPSICFLKLFPTFLILNFIHSRVPWGVSRVSHQWYRFDGLRVSQASPLAHPMPFVSDPPHQPIMGMEGQALSGTQCDCPYPGCWYPILHQTY